MRSTGKRRVTREPGDFWLIRLGDEELSFGRETNDSVAVYDLKTNRIPELSNIEQMKVLFRVPVMDFAMKSGRWQKIGNLPLNSELLKATKFFMQDQFTGELSIYQNGNSRPALREECENLECAAVWDPEHVEDRLRDYYNGVPNKWVESLRIR